MGNTIEATFIKERANWNKLTCKYEDHTYKTTMRFITMEIIHRKDQPVLRFIGGPTGFESYYVESLLYNPPPADTLCICGGTVNSWSKCTVPWEDVKNFLASYGYKSQSLSEEGE